MQMARYKNAWSTWLQFQCFSYNTAAHTETKYSPYDSVSGRIARLPANISDTVDLLYNFGNYALELKYRLRMAGNEAMIDSEKSKLKTKIHMNTIVQLILNISQTSQFQLKLSK